MNTTAGRPRRDDQLTLRLPHELVRRTEVLAAHCGQGRSEFVRNALALADARIVIRTLEATEPMTAEQRAVHKAALGSLSEIEERLSPTPID